MSTVSGKAYYAEGTEVKTAIGGRVVAIANDETDAKMIAESMEITWMLMSFPTRKTLAEQAMDIETLNQELLYWKKTAMYLADCHAANHSEAEKSSCSKSSRARFQRIMETASHLLLQEQGMLPREMGCVDTDTIAKNLDHIANRLKRNAADLVAKDAGDVALFQVGATVQWTSQAGSYSKRKTGEVVLAVPKGKSVHRLLDENPDLKDLPREFDGISRNHESYVIRVKGASPAAKDRLYWPLVSLLKAAE